MFKRVDVTGDEKLEGFSYLNKEGEEEFVSLPYGIDGVINISIDKEIVCVYKEDLPKLIKALEAVYNYKD